jgi:hypothetical protein
MVVLLHGKCLICGGAYMEELWAGSTIEYELFLGKQLTKNNPKFVHCKLFYD